MLDQIAPMPKPRVIAGERHDWELVIGMEVHAQVASAAKLFSGASTTFGAEPNSNVAFVDAGMPGMLPVINEFCVAQAVRTGLGLKAEIHLRSAFDRKNYFYPDLPQGYQISQLYHPIVGEGEVLVELWRRHRAHGPDRAHPSRTGCRQVDPRHGPRPLLRGPQPHRRRADGDRVAPRHSRARGGRRLCHQAAPDHALSGNLRWQHAERQPARRRERLGLPPGSVREISGQPGFRPSRHALRDQEHELAPLHPGRHRGRGPSPDRHPGERRKRDPGDAALRRREGGDAVDALERGGA